MKRNVLLLPILFITALILQSGMASATLASESSFSLETAIDKAGRQRMLTQRIIKAYSQELLDVETIKSQLQRETAITLFDHQLAELKEFAPTDKVRDALATVDTLWLPFKERASGKVTQTGLESLSLASDELLAASHRVVLLLEERSGNNLGHLVNISGRQRMLSQRIAKLYMLRSLGIDSDSVRASLDKASNEFRAALNELNSAPENTPQIRDALTLVNRNWSVFEASFRLRDGSFTPYLIANYSERVLVGMNEITGMYAALSGGTGSH